LAFSVGYAVATAPTSVEGKSSATSVEGRLKYRPKVVPPLGSKS
jgi:hypothetical protein